MVDFFLMRMDEVLYPLNAMIRVVVLLVAVAGLLCGCVNTSQVSDVRAALLESAKRSQPDFPDGRGVKLTHFSHVGELVTSSGQVIHVADQRAVIAGMLSPRGRNCIAFFDDRFRYLGKVGYVSSRPLWCDGSRLYLFGDLDGVATGGSGNVIDVADGYDRLTIHHRRAYGSSGGIDD